MDTLIQDLRFAIRTLRRSPGFFAAAVLTITLGVGATTAIFTVVDRIVLRPLPFPDSERAVMLCETNARVADRCVASPANVADWARTVPALDAAGVARGEAVAVTEAGATFGASAGIATPGFFAVLGATPAMGRLLEDADLHPATNHVVMVTDGFWRQHLNARADVIGRSITIDAREFRVVGVLRPDLYVPSFDTVQLWLPVTAGIDDASRREWRGFTALGKRAARARPDALDRQLDVARAQLALAYPTENAAWGIRTQSVREYVVGSIGATLWLFLAAVGLVLAIACVNVASLMLVRASSRTAEFAVRASLGAGRRRLIRQLLTESAVIAIAGGLAGWLLGAMATRALVAMAPGDIPRLDEVRPDLRIALFTTALTALTAVLFGLAPARAASRTQASHLTAGRLVGSATSRARSVLVVSELTLSVLLLFAAGLLARSFVRLVAWDPGFDRSGLGVSWTYVPPRPGVTTRTAVATIERLRDEVASIPGVTAVGLGSAGPLFGGVESGTIAGSDAAGRDVTVNWFDVDAHYFDALGRRILAGRNLQDADTDGAAPVAVVNESLARRLTGAASPVGRTITLQSHPAVIVGVVSDVRPTRPDRAAAPEVFWPIRQYPRLAGYLVVRSGADVAVIERAIKARAGAVDANLQVSALSSIDRAFGRTLVSPRFNMLLVGAFAGVAALLAAIGVYGVLAYTVANRTREIGLRIALGASPARLRGDVARGALRLALVGVTLGVAVSLATGRALSSWLYGLSPADPLTIGATVVAVLAISLVAGYVPARRASRVDPLVALRPE